MINMSTPEDYSAFISEKGLKINV